MEKGEGFSAAARAVVAAKIARDHITAVSVELNKVNLPVMSVETLKELQLRITNHNAQALEYLNSILGG